MVWDFPPVEDHESTSRYADKKRHHPVTECYILCCRVVLGAGNSAGDGARDVTTAWVRIPLREGHEFAGIKFTPNTFKLIFRGIYMYIYNKNLIVKSGAFDQSSRPSPAELYKWYGYNI